MVLIALASAGAAPNAIADTPPPQLGFHTHRSDALHLQGAQDAGASFVVLVFSWRDIEPVQGYLYWELPDAALRAADYYGLEVVARLDQPPDWALVDEGPAPWDINAYAAFTRRVAERYGDRLAGLIVWNEPNLALEWNGDRPDPAAYAQLLRAAYGASKESAPDLPVVLAGLAFTNGDGDAAVNDLDYLAALYDIGVGNAFDVLAAHPYGFGRPPEESPAADRLNFRRLELHRALMDAYGDKDKPIWITEMGWRTAAPNPADAWQVISEADQAAYTLRALDLAREQWPWLEHMAFWELNADADGYGYAFWQGPERTSAAYRQLVERAAPPTEHAASSIHSQDAAGQVEILAADVIVRLGGRGDLHPHWVHLRGDGEDQLAWSAEFFLLPEQVRTDYSLFLETMQVDQPTNRLALNGVELGYLNPRTRPDQTSTWATQRFSIPAHALRPGVNRLTLTAGLRSPIRQYEWWRHENLQVRNVRLQLEEQADSASALAWHALPSPGSWAEVHRLRLADSAGDAALWVMANRSGQLWRLELAPDGSVSAAHDESGNPGLTFLDVAFDGDNVFAATDRGLYFRQPGDDAWLPVPGAPIDQAHIVFASGGRIYAGFEGRGLWGGDTLGDTLRLDGLADSTVLDLAATPSGTLYAATDSGVFRRDRMLWSRLPNLPTVTTAGARGAFITRVFTGDEDGLVVRNEDHLWLWSDRAGWTPYGPDALQGEAFAVIDCCAPGSALIATNRLGLWSQTVEGNWARVDGDYLSSLELTGGVTVGETTIIAANNGLYAATLGDSASTSPGSAWRPVLGLSPTVSDLLVAGDGMTWLAGTPSGVWRSLDGGLTWDAVSPPWIVWDLARGPDNRLYVARDDGVAYADSWADESIVWHESDGLDTVTFFDVSPNPAIDGLLWAGAWGNNIGVSVDGGASIQPLHNGLETLSVLDVLWHATPGQVTVATIEGMYRTDDGGAIWFKLPGALASQTVYALHQTEDGSILAGAADGLWASIDYGATWFRLGDLPAVTVLRVGELVSGAETVLWAGTEDAGLWLSADGGASWKQAGPDGHSVYAVQTLANGELVAATVRGLYGTQQPRRP